MSDAQPESERPEEEAADNQADVEVAPGASEPEPAEAEAGESAPEADTTPAPEANASAAGEQASPPSEPEPAADAKAKDPSASTAPLRTAIPTAKACHCGQPSAPSGWREKSSVNVCARQGLATMLSNARQVAKPTCCKADGNQAIGLSFNDNT